MCQSVMSCGTSLQEAARDLRANALTGPVCVLLSFKTSCFRMPLELIRTKQKETVEDVTVVRRSSVARR